MQDNNDYGEEVLKQTEEKHNQVDNFEGPTSDGTKRTRADAQNPCLLAQDQAESDISVGSEECGVDDLSHNDETPTKPLSATTEFTKYNERDASQKASLSSDQNKGSQELPMHKVSKEKGAQQSLDYKSKIATSGSTTESNAAKIDFNEQETDTQLNGTCDKTEIGIQELRNLQNGHQQPLFGKDKYSQSHNPLNSLDNDTESLTNTSNNSKTIITVKRKQMEMMNSTETKPMTIMIP